MGNAYHFKTFEEWCIENNRYDILDLWDFDLNELDPTEIPYGTKNRYYFLCPNGIHESKTRRISHITDRPNHKIICRECEYNQDLTGKIFGELEVIGYDAEGTKCGNRRWMCKCSCGNVVSVLESKLKSGNKLTCGGQYRHKLIKSQSDECDSIIDIFDPSYIKELRHSNDYYDYRKEVQKKDGYRCIVCGSNKNIEVHHIYPFAEYPNERFNPNTGICLCKVHHSISEPNSFHTIYGRYNNTPEQLEEYVNNMRQLLGINKHFDVYSYMNNIDTDNMEIDDSMLII